MFPVAVRKFFLRDEARAPTRHPLPPFHVVRLTLSSPEMIALLLRANPSIEKLAGPRVKVNVYCGAALPRVYICPGGPADDGFLRVLMEIGLQARLIVLRSRQFIWLEYSFGGDDLDCTPGFRPQ